MPETTWEHFRTSGLPPRDRLNRWTRWGERLFGNMRVRPEDPRGFFGEASWTSFGALTISEFRFTPSHAENPLDENGAAFEDAIVLSLPQYGTCTYRDSRQAAVLRKGDLYIRDLSQPWQLTTQGQTGLITLRIPFAEFAARFGDPAAYANRAYSSQRAEVACVSGIIHSALTLLRADMDRSRRSILAETVLDSLRLLRDETAGKGRSNTPTLRRQALLHIAQNLADPGLSPGSVSRAVGVSQRDLQRAFQKSGETMQGVILEQRLSRAASLLLAKPAQYRNRITHLAIALGFSDGAYFSRAFSKRFGIPPSRFVDGPAATGPHGDGR